MEQLLCSKPVFSDLLEKEGYIPVSAEVVAMEATQMHRGRQWVKTGWGGGRLLAMQGAGWVWTARSTLGSEIHREGHEYSSGNTSLTQPPPLRGADAHTRCSAVTERKPYGSLRVTDLPKAIKKKGVIFHFFFCQDQVSALFCSEACHF